MAPTISTRQRNILEFIEQQIRERGYPPSVREIGDRRLASLLIVAASAKTVWLNFYHYTDEDEPYVYVQTFEGGC